MVEDSAKILVAFGLSVGEFESAVQIGLERVGDGDGIDLAGAEEVLQVELAHSTGADQAHANPVVGPQDALRERASGSDHAANGGSCKALVEVPPSYL